MWCFVSLVLVASTSAIDWLERLLSEIKPYTLTHLQSCPHHCTADEAVAKQLVWQHRIDLENIIHCPTVARHWLIRQFAMTCFLDVPSVLSVMVVSLAAVECATHLGLRAKWSWLECRRKASSRTGWVMPRERNWMKVLSTRLKPAKYAHCVCLWGFDDIKTTHCFVRKTQLSTCSVCRTARRIY